MSMSLITKILAVVLLVVCCGAIVADSVDGCCEDHCCGTAAHACHWTHACRVDMVGQYISCTTEYCVKISPERAIRITFIPDAILLPPPKLHA